ncbi:MAG: PRD domain-containing protein [Bacilli bacterium]
MVNTKLELLKTQNVISSQSYDYLNEVLSYLINENHITTNDEAEVLITHLAMACFRSEKEDQSLNQLDNLIKEQLVISPSYQQALEIWQSLKEMAPISFVSIEDDYMIMHLITLISN